MLMPKKVKFRKQQRGRMRGKAWRGSDVSFGDFGLQALEPCWLTDRQIEAARVAMTRFIKRGGKIWVRVFPDKPITKKPQETRMGKGKGAPDQWVAVVRPGRVLFEMEGVSGNRSTRSVEAGGGEAADPDQVRHPLCAGEDAMKAAELRDLGADELGAKERDLSDQMFRLRIQKSMGQLEAPNKLRTVRRDLARVKTVLDKRERVIGESGSVGQVMCTHQPTKPRFTRSENQPMSQKSEKTRHRRQQQDAEEHRRRGRVAGAARTLRQDPAPDLDLHGARRGQRRRRSATPWRSWRRGRSAAASAGRSSGWCVRRYRSNWAGKAGTGR